MLTFKKKQKQPPVRVVQIARHDWEKEDAAAAKHFFASKLYERIRAICDSQLVKNILTHETSADYRKGWIDCQRQHQAFGNVDVGDEADSLSRTSMQEVDYE